MDEQEKYRRLIDRLLKGEQLTPEDQEFVDRYYDGFDERPDVLDTMSEYEVSDIKERLRKRIDEHIDPDHKPKRVIKWQQYKPILKIAATLLVVSFIAVLGYRYFSADSDGNPLILLSYDADFPVGSVYEAYEELRQVRLPDGTLVFLNAHSSLKVDKDFGKNNRRVHLQGEAYFDVAKRAHMPFIVYNKEAQVEVLGTSFWVNERDMSNYVTLVTGKVQFVERAENITLHPNERVGKSSVEGTYDIGVADLSRLTSWKPESFLFQDVSIGEFFEFLQSRYSLEIKVSDPDIYACRITTSVEGSETWEDLLLVVSMVNGFTYQVVDNHIIIEGQDCLSAK